MQTKHLSFWTWTNLDKSKEMMRFLQVWLFCRSDPGCSLKWANYVLKMQPSRVWNNLDVFLPYITSDPLSNNTFPKMGESGRLIYTVHTWRELCYSFAVTTFTT